MKRFLIMWLLGGIATIVATATLTGLTLANHGWWGYLTLTRHGVTIDGVVVRTDPQNHCLAEYTFNIDDRQYRGGAAECGVTVGEMVLVTYLPESPMHSCIGSARDHLTNELASFAAGGVIFPPILIAAWRRRRKASTIETTTQI